MTDPDASFIPTATGQDDATPLSSVWGDATVALTGPVAAWGSRDVVVIAGPEAISYLQGQASQDIAGLGVGHSRRTLVLSPQGRIDTWARVTRMADDVLWLDTDTGFGPQLEDRLRRFLLRTKATITTHTMDQAMIRWPEGSEIDAGLFGGAAAPASLNADDPVGSSPRWLEVAWPTVTGIDVLYPAPNGALEPGISVTMVDAAVGEALRIQAGIPVMGAELGEKTIPAEAPIIEQSVDFTKGCYTGQELVARVDSRGNRTPRRIWGLIVDPASGSAGGTVSGRTVSGGVERSASIIRQGEVIGAVTSVVRVPSGAGYEIAAGAAVIGLASLGRDHGAGPVEVVSPAGGASVSGMIVELAVSDRR